jgi:hypothetical protein
MREWVDIAINWIPIVLGVAAYGYLLVNALEARRRLAFFCGKPWIWRKKKFFLVMGLFEPDTEANERPNERTLLVDPEKHSIAKLPCRGTLDQPQREPHAPIQVTPEDGSQVVLLPTASKAWISHTVEPAVLTEQQLQAGKEGQLLIGPDGTLWRYEARPSYLDLQPRWQQLVPLLSGFLSWDDTNAAKAVADILPRRQVDTVLRTSIEFSGQGDADRDPVLYVGSPRSTPQLEHILASRRIEVHIEQDRIADGKTRYVQVNGKQLCSLGPEKHDDRLGVIVRIERGKEKGVCTCVFGCSARITKLTGECLARHWKVLSRLAKNKGCDSFVAVFHTDKHKRTLPMQPDLFPLKGGTETPN